MIRQALVLDKDEHVVAVLSNNLPDTCRITALRQQQQAREDGGYNDKLTLTVPGDHPDAVYVKEGSNILFQDGDGYWQEYNIVTPERVDADTSTITAAAEHTSYELLGEPIFDVRPTNTTAGDAAAQALLGTRWQLGLADNLGVNSIRLYRTNVRAALTAIATKWGGELRFRLTVVGGVITGRYVDILSRRGQDTGKRFEIGKDLTSVKQTINRQSLCTAIIPLGKGVEIPQEEGGDPTYGRRLTIADIEWSIDSGDPLDKPLDQLWIGDDDARLAYGPTGRHIFDYATFEDCTDPQELIRLGYEELQRRKTPLVTYSLDVLVLEEATGHAHDAVRLGDTVRAINNVTPMPIIGIARVIELDINLINPTDGKVVLGNFIPNSSSAMSKIKQAQQSMLDRSGSWDRAGQAVIPPPSGSALKNAIDLLTTQLFSTDSHSYTDASGNFVFESADGTKALKLGGGILALANTKTGGQFNWTTFATGDGITATEVLAAIGSFAFLRAGNPPTDPAPHRLEMGIGENNIPYLRMYDSDGDLAVALDEGTLKLGDYAVQRWTTLGGHRHGIGMFPRALE